MKSKQLRRPALTLVAVLVVIAVTGLKTLAGGPLYLTPTSSAVKWPVGPNFAGPVGGGPLGSQTVDSTGTVVYHVDSGTLGPLSNAQAVAIVDRIFGLYNAIPTSSIRFRDGGPILDPATGNPFDVNGANMGRVLGNTSTFQNPIIFDTNGDITGDPTILGEFGALQFDSTNTFINEGFVVMNGAPLTIPFSRGGITTSSLIGVFTHEFAHLAGPLDHEQINGDIASFGEGFSSSDPLPGLLPTDITTPAAAYDLFAPFTETLFPLLYPAPNGSQLGTQFLDSGYFVANLDLDTQNAISDLYPTADYLNSRGAIQGRVIIRSSGGDIPLDNLNVVARRIDQGAYPPPPGTVAYPTPPTVDASGIPSRPPAQAATDSLATVSSAVSGLNFGTGTYRIQGLPPGNYMVELQQINQDFNSGSGIGQAFNQLTLPVPYEYYNGATNSSTSPATFVPVTVAQGQTTNGIDLIIDGVNASNLTPIPEETKSHFKLGQAQPLTFPCEVTGSVSVNDNAQLRFIFDSAGDLEFVNDLYQFTVTDTRIFFITLTGTSGTSDADIDLFLWTSGVNKKKSNFNDPNLVGLSISPTTNESIAVQLTPGTYIIGVSGAAGSENYKLRVIPSL